MTVQTRHAVRETELLVDGKVVGYRQTPARHRPSVTALTAELPGDPPEPFAVTLHVRETAEGAPTCVLEIAGRSHPMPELPLARPGVTSRAAGRPPLRSARRLLRNTLRRWG
ncbi:hypothetical protein [Streptomyces cyanogenus]|uniref:hypothetical protein n=1 Tax=Streptomyces cyanogenus TaxID=80860 RepID=UPI001AA130E7|nr:hypothetical protein [Streptomyces cyanogenus]